ncbi:hypothetical protein [Paucilactobacillus nenjiangensis]|uniref:hypothetical protein n=1 Tax=Paucilactobacillus nenjiangensis TaxID=1296540 RepID=UPI0028D2A570|nr:hypothetical protein [Paucilactobacillus nenjiangensis]
MKKKVLNTLIIISTIIMVGCVLLSLQSNPFSVIDPQHDSSMFIYFGRGMSNGLIPYIDMLDHKGPMLWFINFIADLIDKVASGWGLFIVELIFIGAAYYSMLKISKLLKSTSLVYLLTILSITPVIMLLFNNGNYTEEYAFTFILWALYLLIRNFVTEENTKLSLFIIGSLGSATFFLRPNMISVWVVFCLMFLFFGIFTKKYFVLRKQALWIFIGGTSVVCLISLYGILTNSFSEMWNDSIIINMMYSTSSTVEKINSGKFFLKLFWQNGILWSVFGYTLIVLLNWKNYNLKYKFMHITLLIGFVVNFLTIIMSGRNYWHYGVTQLPYFFIMICFSLVTITNIKFKKIHKYCLITIIAAIPIVFSAKYMISNLVYINTTIFPNHTGRKISNSHQIISYIDNHTTKNQKIYVHNIDANIYLQSGRFANSKYFVLPAIDYDKTSKFKTDFENSFEHSYPKFIVVTKVMYTQDHENDFMMNNYIYDVIQKKYTKVKSIHGEMLLFKLNPN